MQLRKFEAGDFLNIFLRFLDFWGSFSHKNFSCQKAACIFRFRYCFPSSGGEVRKSSFFLILGQIISLLSMHLAPQLFLFVSKYLLKCLCLLFDFGMFKKCHVFYFFLVRIFGDHCLKTLSLIMIDFIW